MDIQKCGRCGKRKQFTEFGQKPTGEYNKTCKVCIREKFTSSRCVHSHQKSQCHLCKGGSICEHNKRRTHCAICGGGGLCEHGKIHSRCKDCDGTSYCSHGRLRRICKECKGNAICPHNRERYVCKECHGCNICSHMKQRKQCPICDPSGYIRHIVTERIKKALLKNKTEHTIDYLGCDIATFKKHIENQFQEGMSWDNHGDGQREWAIDHIIPIKWNNPTLEEVKQRLHYTNTQPLWSSSNMSKNNRIRPEDELTISKIWNQLTPELQHQWLIRNKSPPPTTKIVLKLKLKPKIQLKINNCKN